MKAKYLSLPLAMTLGIGACDDMLTENPESFITTDNYYRTPADIENAAVAIYNNLLQWDWLKLQAHWTYGLAADEGTYHPESSSPDVLAPEFLNWTSLSGDAVKIWRMNYVTILRANLVIDKAPGVQFASDAQQQELIAEGKFMRAFSYFWLVRTFGGVPLYLSAEEQRKAGKPRAGEAEVLAQIIQDASEAEAALPWKRTGSQIGRANKASALTLLADAHRWRANVLKTTAAADWRAAAEATRKVMDSGAYGLNNSYLESFTPRSERRPEEVFAVIATGTGWNQAALWGGVYWPRDLGSGGGWAAVIPTARFYNSYLPGDYRKEATFWSQGCSANLPVDCPNPTTFTPRLSEGRSASDFPGITTEGYPHVNKYRISDRGRNFWTGSDVNVPLYRYAEVLLIHAEAQLELGNQGEALRAVNQIRARARKGAGNENRTQPADLASVDKDILYRERSWELAFELKRWFDLVQRGPDYFVSQIRTFDPQATLLGNVNPNHMRLPIPQQEIQSDQAITQNPGY